MLLSELGNLLLEFVVLGEIFEGGIVEDIVFYFDFGEGVGDLPQLQHL